MSIDETHNNAMKKDGDFYYAYYNTLRKDARKLAVDALNERITQLSHRQAWNGITLASMNMEAVEYARTNWPKHYPEWYSGLEYSWERLFYRYSAKPSNFNIAIWQQINGERILQGLSLGKASKGKKNLTIHWLERNWAQNYIKGGVILPILTAAEEYAKLLGCEHVSIKNAIDENEFTQYGYMRHDKSSKENYLIKELNHG